jgi:hypothetical protein
MGFAFVFFNYFNRHGVYIRQVFTTARGQRDSTVFGYSYPRHIDTYYDDANNKQTCLV